MNGSIKTAIDIVGTQKKLAEACGVSQAAVQKWLHDKSKVAPENVLSLVNATNGMVKAHEIRPDLPIRNMPPKQHQAFTKVAANLMQGGRRGPLLT
jgi:DNA-binding transcriptional regulator YdaS (Cro superfamily)